MAPSPCWPATSACASRIRTWRCSIYAQLLQHQKRHDEAKAFLQRFFNATNSDTWRSQGFVEAQRHSIDRGIPPILIATLPKSGSVFLLNTLVEGLSAPSTYLCPVGMYSDVLIERRARDFALGGCICVDHIEATPQTLDTLHDLGVRRIAFHHRDLRQAVLSMVHHSVSDEQVTRPRDRVLQARETFDRTLEHNFMVYLKQWSVLLDSWADALADYRFQFMVSDFDDLDDEKALFERILDFNGVDRSLFDWSILDTNKQDRAGHFRKGLKAEWKTVLRPEFQERVDAWLAGNGVVERLQRAIAKRVG